MTLATTKELLGFFSLAPSSAGIINGVVFDGVVLEVAAPAGELCHRFNVAESRM